jgi:hypothetical protein
MSEPTDIPSLRAQILREAEQVISNDRNNTYGEPEDLFTDIAAYWSAWFGHEVSGFDVAMAMALFKVARCKANPAHRDSFTDLAGYGAIAYEVGRASDG